MGTRRMDRPGFRFPLVLLSARSRDTARDVLLLVFHGFLRKRD